MDGKCFPLPLSLLTPKTPLKMESALYLKYLEFLYRWKVLSINSILIPPKAFVKMKSTSCPLFPLGHFLNLGILLHMCNPLI
jgi:hypothetical protein